MEAVTSGALNAPYDRAHAIRLETLETLNQAEFARTYNRLHGTGAIYRPVGSGMAVFTGVGSPLSQAFALGLQGEVSPEELDELEEFFRSRGGAVEIEVCEYAHPTLMRLLEKRNYELTERSNVLVRELGPADDDPSFANDVLLVQEEQLEMFARAVASAFSEGKEPSEELTDIFRVFFHQSNASCFGALVDGVPAGAGTLFIQENVAELGGAGTLPQFRGRGIQSDLLKARCAHARAAGCTEAMVTTAPDTISQRNAERNGFRVAYRRFKHSNR